MSPNEKAVADAVKTAVAGSGLTNAQRTYVFLGALIEQRMLTATGSNQGGIVAAMRKAHKSLGVEAKDVERLWWLVRAAGRGDLEAVKMLEKVKAGSVERAALAYERWHWRQAPSVEVKPTVYMPRAELGEEDRKWVLNQARKVAEDHNLKTSGQKSLAMTRALLARGLVRLDAAGGPVASPGVRATIEKAIGVKRHEIGHAITVLRKHAAGKLPQGGLESVESGRYSTCATIADLSSRGRRSVEVKKAKDWLVTEAKKVNNGPYVSVSAKAVAFLEVLIRELVLDPSTRSSKGMRAAEDVAVEVLNVGVSKLSRHEFGRCWTVLRLVKLGKIPGEAIQSLRSGASSAQVILKDGAKGLTRSIRAKLSPVESFAEVEPEPVEVAVALTEDAAIVVGDPLEAILELAAEALGQVDAIVKKAKNTEDREVARLGAQLREALSETKARATRITNGRHATALAGRTA